jgi:hypothetical protein
VSHFCSLRWFSLVFAGWGLFDVTAYAETTASRSDPAQASTARAITAEALHREAFGQNDQRRELLQRVSAEHPDYAPAKWHQGLVQLQDRWIKAEDLPGELQAEAKISDYRRIRERYPLTAAGQMGLANWCKDRGLRDRERAHLTKVVELEPDHAEARRRLGFRRVGLDWLSEDEIRQAAEKQAADQAALRRWLPEVNQIRRQLHSRSQGQRQKAQERLVAIATPATGVAIEQGLWNDGLEAARAMIGALASLADPETSLRLARQAVVSPFDSVRQAAAEQLRNRDRDTYAPALLAMLYTPASSRVEVVPTASGRLLYRYVVEREGQNERQSLVLDTTYQRIPLPGGDGIGTLQRALQQVQMANWNREREVMQNNFRTEELNDRVCAALSVATEQYLPTEPESWWQWWNETNEVYMSGDKPTKSVQMTDQVALADFVPSPTLSSSERGSSTPRPPARMDCLAAGTLVWTDAGTAPIEQIQVGDLVLAQDPESGELAYQPVLRTTVRPEGPLVRVCLMNREVLETSGGHLFWVSGTGWTKARELQSGCELHGVTGAVRVSLAETGSSAETYNLIVADSHSYFIGEDKILCHDNTVRRPTTATVPGLLAE